MKVIGAGIGRTGTLSLKAALERLGFGPRFHGRHVLDHPNRAARCGVLRRRSGPWSPPDPSPHATVRAPGLAPVFGVVGTLEG